MKRVALILGLLLTLTPIAIAQCRVCDPLSISDYGLRGLCLYLNFIICNPIFIVMVIIFVLVIFILGKLLGR